MPNGYIGPTNNHVGMKPRASHLKKPEPERFVPFEVLVSRMIAAFGTPEGESTRHAVLKRMGIEPAKG